LDLGWITVLYCVVFFARLEIAHNRAHRTQKDKRASIDIFNIIQLSQVLLTKRQETRGNITLTQRRTPRAIFTTTTTKAFTIIPFTKNLAASKRFRVLVTTDRQKKHKSSMDNEHNNTSEMGHNDDNKQKSGAGQLFTEDVVLMYYSKSRDAKPGKGTGEQRIIIHESGTFKYGDLEALAQIPDGRKRLSNFDESSPFLLDGCRWRSVEHFFQSRKFIQKAPWHD
jgi:hypothetical protein